MSLIQYEYIVAVDTYRSFVTAAEKCFVTQPTLSMQIQKLESTLGVKIFNRYGKLVFSTKSTTGYWDGNFGGQGLPAGVYYWILDGYDDYNQLKISKGGSIMLAR